MLPLLFVIVILAALLILIPGLRERVVEGLKSFSDACVVALLRGTSRFGADLTEEGRSEQLRWSEQRMRNLRGLALRSKSRYAAGDQAKRDSD